MSSSPATKTSFSGGAVREAASPVGVRVHCVSRSIASNSSSSFLLSATAKNYRHPGNQELLNLVRQNASSFHLGSLSDRKAIATAIVDMIRLGGGRFLRYHMSDNVWRDVEGDAAHYKVMQALRETKPAMDFLKDDVLKVRDCGDLHAS
jgi:hypothetical protein